MFVLYGSLPVEYLHLWKGSLAGYTSPEGEALLLSMMVGVQGTILRRGALHNLSHSQPQPMCHSPITLIKTIHFQYAFHISN